MKIIINDKAESITNNGKVYITKRNDHNGKGAWYDLYKGLDGKQYVKFWKEQVAELVNNRAMGRCYDIVK